MTPDPLASELLRLDAQADDALLVARFYARWCAAWVALGLVAVIAAIVLAAFGRTWWPLVLPETICCVALSEAARAWSAARCRSYYLTGRMSGLVAAATAPDAVVGRRSVIVRVPWDAARKGAAS